MPHFVVHDLDELFKLKVRQAQIQFEVPEGRNEGQSGSCGSPACGLSCREVVRLQEPSAKTSPHTIVFLLWMLLKVHRPLLLLRQTSASFDDMLCKFGWGH
jgi:hypothetical protein